MSVSEEVEAEIRRMYFAEHWPMGTVASQLAQHADVVRRMLKLDTPRTPVAERLLLVEPYKDFIEQTLGAGAGSWRREQNPDVVVVHRSRQRRAAAI